MANNFSIDGQITAAAETVTSSETFTGPTTFSGAVTIPSTTGSLSVVAVSNSANIGTTLSSLVSFYGAAGTSQRTAGAQVALTCTALSPTTASSVVGFSSTAQFSNCIGLINEIRQVLVDAGLMKGS